MLKSALSLARLRARRDRKAAQILPPVYQVFADGLQIAGAREAKALLDVPINCKTSRQSQWAGLHGHRRPSSI